MHAPGAKVDSHQTPCAVALRDASTVLFSCLE